METVEFEGKQYRVDPDDFVVKVRQRRSTSTRSRSVGEVWTTVRGPKRQRVLESLGILEFGDTARPAVTIAPYRR